MSSQPAIQDRQFSPKDRLLVEVSPGELLDKITILEIKRERITESQKQANIRFELAHLWDVEQRLPDVPGVIVLRRRLRIVNEALWDVEDAIRDCERRHDFGNQFVELARKVYRYNDERAQLKRAINEVLGSRLIEEKSYTQYA